MNTIDLVTNEKVMFIFGLIGIILIKLSIPNIKTIDAITAPLAIALMFNFMASFLFIGMFGYKK